MKQVSVGIYVIAALSDWYDGWLARKFNYITSWGKFWDPLADKILTSSAFIGFTLVELIPVWMVIIIVGRDVIITLLRVFADMKNYVFTTSYYAKWKTMLQMIFLYYLLILYVSSQSTEIYSKFGNIISIFLTQHLVFYIGLLVTIITLHSGILYISRNWELIIKLLRIED